jgi:hypothetical protein
VHDLTKKEPTSENMMECEIKVEEEEGCMNLIMSDDDMVEGDRWRTPDDSCLEMEREDETETFYVNVLVEHRPSPCTTEEEEFLAWKDGHGGVHPRMLDRRRITEVAGEI